MDDSMTQSATKGNSQSIDKVNERNFATAREIPRNLRVPDEVGFRVCYPKCSRSELNFLRWWIR